MLEEEKKKKRNSTFDYDGLTSVRQIPCSENLVKLDNMQNKLLWSCGRAMKSQKCDKPRSLRIGNAFW